jgi:hypothetical protein
MYNQYLIKITYKYTIVVLMLILHCAGCEYSVKYENKYNTNEINIIITQIDEMPDWITNGKMSASDNNNNKYVNYIEKTMKVLAKYDLDKLRDAITIMNNKPAQYSRKLYLINKYIFNLPNEITNNDINYKYFMDGWDGMPYKKITKNSRVVITINARWPWKEDENGQWRLIGYSTMRNGPPYDALERFDKYNEIYGKRKIAKPSVPK